jgi:hypothetical protein
MTGDHTSERSAMPQTAAMPGGLQVAQDGYRLVPATAELSTTDPAEFRFQIVGPDGKPVTAFATAHDKQLHLVIVRRDLTGFQHVHPQLQAGGTWSIPLRVNEPGPYRIFADFQPEGRASGLVLGVDVTAPGNYLPAPRSHSTTMSTVDGYTVTVEGQLVPGTASRLTLTVSKDGVPVTDLQPYLGPSGTWSRCATVIWPTCTCTRRKPPRPGRRSSFTPRFPALAPTGCSWTSRTTAPCTPPTSPPPPTKGTGHEHPDTSAFRPAD